MNRDEFLRRAATISDDPLSRVSDLVREIKDDDNVIYETHCHLFGKSAVADWYWIMRLLENINPDGWFVEFADRVFQQTKDNHLDETLEILNCDKPGQVLSRYMKRPGFDKYIYAPLMMDLRNWVDQEKDIKPLSRQVDDLLELAGQEPILPFFSLDPRRAEVGGEENLYTLFLRAFENRPGFFGVKLYPALGYLPADPRLMPIYEVCADKRIPVTVHCGSTTIRSFEIDLKVSGKFWRNGTVHEWTNQSFRQRLFHRNVKVGGRRLNYRANFLNDPRHWLPVLNDFRTLRLNLAHLGGTDHWRQYVDTGRDGRVTHIHHLMEEFQVYSDFSGMHLHPDILQRFIEIVETDSFPRFRDRCMFGTDFWVTVPAGDYEDFLAQYDRMMPDDLKALFDRDNPKAFLFGT